MGGKPRASSSSNGNGHDIPKKGWAEPPPVKDKPIKYGFHSCGAEAVYTAMMKLIPGGDIYQVAFVCSPCNEQFSQSMTWADAQKIRIRAYALEGRELCHCGDPVLDKDGKPHRHDDLKKDEGEGEGEGAKT